MPLSTYPVIGKSAPHVNEETTPEPKKPIPVLYEPKRQNRFILEFPEEFEIEAWLVQAATRPKIKIDFAKLQTYVDPQPNVIEKYDWEEMTIEFIDPIGPSISGKLFTLPSALKVTKSDNYLFKYYMVALDPLHNPVEKWEIAVKDIVLDFGCFDYGDDNLVRPSMKIKPAYCTLLY